MESYDAVYRLIEEERTAYLKALRPPDPDWPPDVAAVIEDVHAHLFEGTQVRDVRTRRGLRDNNISIRFGYFLGMGIKDYILHHRITFAKRLLCQYDIPIKYVAWAVGYDNPSGFSSVFKSRVDMSPSDFRKKEENVKERICFAPLAHSVGLVLVLYRSQNHFIKPQRPWSRRKP